MDILTDFSKKIQPPSAVALGYFDCLHPGHVAVISAAVKSGLTPGVFSFHLDENAPKGKLIFSPQEKERRLADMGVAFLTDFSFSQICALDGPAFFRQILMDQLGAKQLVCGSDFRFGKGAAWDVSDLSHMCIEANVALTIVPDVYVDGVIVHSSTIRTALADGDIATANRLLGREFTFSGEIIHGNELGRTVGMPTINIAIPRAYTVPKFGVYASRTQIGDRTMDSITNIGVKPTVGADTPLYETYLFDFDEDVYGQTATVSLYGFIRPERKFENLDRVRTQVQADIHTAKAVLALYKQPTV